MLIGAWEQLRWRYLFPPDAEVPLEHEGYPRPGEALPLGTPEPPRGSCRQGAPGKRPAPPTSRRPTYSGGTGFVFIKAYQVVLQVRYLSIVRER